MKATRLLQRVLRRARALATSLSLASMAVLIGTFLAAGAQAKTITVDGNISDWSDVPILATDPVADFADPACGAELDRHRDLTSIKITADAQNLYYLLTYRHSACSSTNPIGEALRVWFDIDSNASTGCIPFEGAGFDLALYLAPSSTRIDGAYCNSTNVNLTSATAWNFDSVGIAYVEGSIPIGLFPNEAFRIQSYPDNLSAPATVTLTPSANPPNFSLSPTTLNFGLIYIKTTSSKQTVSLTNTGGPGLSVTGLTLLGVNKGDFMISDNSCLGAISQAGCSFSVSFSPSTTSLEAAHITVVSNAATTANNVGLLGTGATSGQISRFGTGPAPTTQVDLLSALVNSGTLTYPPTPLPSTDRKALNSVFADAARAEVENLLSGSSADGCYLSTVDAARIEANRAFIRAGLLQVADNVFTIAALTGMTTGSVVGDIIIHFTAGTALGALQGQPIGEAVATSLVDASGQVAKYALGKLVTDYIAQGGAAVVDGFDQYLKGQISDAFRYEGVFAWGLSGSNCSGEFCSRIAQDSGNQANFTAQMIYDPHSHYITAVIASTCKSISTGALLAHKAYYVVQQIDQHPSTLIFIPAGPMLKLRAVDLP